MIPSQYFVLFLKPKSIPPLLMSTEMDGLKTMLARIETHKNYCTIIEVININNSTVSQKSITIGKQLRQATPSPFVFLFNKN